MAMTLPGLIISTDILKEIGRFLRKMSQRKYTTGPSTNVGKEFLYHRFGF